MCIASGGALMLFAEFGRLRDKIREAPGNLDQVALEELEERLRLERETEAKRRSPQQERPKHHE